MASNGIRQEHQQLLERLLALRQSLLEVEQSTPLPQESTAAEERHASRTNFLQYLKLRQSDLRPLQTQLGRLGLSSLSHSEKNVLATVTAVTSALSAICNSAPAEPEAQPPYSMEEADALASKRAAELLGPLRPGHASRIMVTLPASAATDHEWVRQCVRSGMALARINCAHDDAETWTRMVDNVRRAAESEGASVVIQMDLGGPKLRTESATTAEPVLRLKPGRDEYGEVVAPARVLLCDRAYSAQTGPQDYSLGVDPHWLSLLTPGARVRFLDRRGRKRTLTWQERTADGVLMLSDRTAYVGPQTRLTLDAEEHSRRRSFCHVRGLPPPTLLLKLSHADEFWLAEPGWVQPTTANASDAANPVISCTLPVAISRLQVGHAVWLDDGRIGTLVEQTAPGGALLRVFHPPAGTVALRTDKGINMPDTDLALPFLSERDKRDFEFIRTHADIVALSFVQKPADLDELESEWKRGPNQLRGAVLKIETRAAFAHLPALLLRSIDTFNTGVMIARGDLAVECGWERLAEVQEEILWLCEAAHVPVVWATSVLDRLAKTGQATRAEITDAAMGERAECIMLNKGPFILEAIRALADIASRMQRHQTKKHPQLNDLKVTRSLGSSASS